MNLLTLNRTDMTRTNPNYPFRDRHDDQVDEQTLIKKAELVKQIAKASGLSVDQVLKLMRTESINRLTEVILDAGDDLDDKWTNGAEGIKKHLEYVRNWLYDNQPYKIKLVDD